MFFFRRPLPALCAAVDDVSRTQRMSETPLNRRIESGAQTESGLDAATAAARLAAEGANELGPSAARSLGAIAWEVAREPTFVLLLASGAIYLAMGDAHEALALLGFVLVIMGITISQERRTDNTLEALRDMSSPRALVIRSGQALRIAGREVVRGDLMLLSEGDRVPADGELLQAHELALDESLQTGESQPVSKTGQDKVLAGTLVVRGQGLVRVTATGAKTALGLIGQSLRDIAAEPSPLRDEISRLMRRLLMLGLALSLALAWLFWLLRGDALQAVLAGITLAMSIMPQEFAVIMIVFLALGARRLAASHVLTRRLNAIETLGTTSVLCVDKTGTLTQNRMALAALCVGDELLDVAALLHPNRLPASPLPENFHELLEYAVLASELAPHDPMEQALHQFAGLHFAGTGRLHPDWLLAREYELSAEQLVMSHLWQIGTGANDVVAAKGAPEAVAALCQLPAPQRARLAAQAAQMADRGLRVLGVAKALHHSAERWPEAQAAFEFEFVGLLGLADPLRPEVPEAVAQCQRAGIRVVMITGDHARTAAAIASQAGIAGAQVLTGAEIEALAPQALAALLNHGPTRTSAAAPALHAQVNVFARVTPQQKLKLIEAFKAAGHVVAMTGDGVNDAPALKAAHIGVAMGQRGTDVAREAASLVLLQDDFTAIVGAIRLGRRIFANLRQAMVYTLAVHVPIIGLTMLPVLFGLPLLLAPLHIAFLELVIDPACSIVFEAEQGRGEGQALMAQPPRLYGEPLIDRQHVLEALLQGIWVVLMVMGLDIWLLAQGSSAGDVRTASFVALVTANAVLIFPTRSRCGNWRQLFTGLSATPLWVLAATLSALVAVTGVPVVASAFDFAPISPLLWLLAFSVGLAMLPVFQLSKLALRRAWCPAGAQ
jgi:Ca2+-transporting ATPase